MTHIIHEIFHNIPARFKLFVVDEMDNCMRIQGRKYWTGIQVIFLVFVFLIDYYNHFCANFFNDRKGSKF